MKLNKFYPLSKMVDQADGTLRVYGLVTAEVPDLDREVCDYAKTKPYYLAKVEAMKKATDIPGMEQSIMPMREMHTLNAIGKGVSIDFDDLKKTINMGFEVVDPLAITKFKKGVLVGFSQGGDFVGPKVLDPKFPGCKKYVANPGEVSAVDSPCLPIATVDWMKAKQFEHVKADGSMEMRKFHLPVAIDADQVEQGLVKVNDRVMEECPETESEFNFVHAGVTKYFKTKAPEFSVEKKFEELEALIRDGLTKSVVPGPGITVAEHPVPPAQVTPNPTVFTCPDCNSTAVPVGTDQSGPLKCSSCGKVFTKGAQQSSFSSVLKLLIASPSDELKKQLVEVMKKQKLDASDLYGKTVLARDFVRAYTATGDLKKCMADVTDLAQVLQTLRTITVSQIFDLENELDGSSLPKDLYGLMESTVTILKDLVEEETREILAAAGGILGGKAMTKEELKKSAGHIAKAKEMATSFNNHMAGVNKAHHDHVNSLHKAHVDGMAACATPGECVQKAAAHANHITAINGAHLAHATALGKAHVDAMHGVLNKAMSGYDSAGNEPGRDTLLDSVQGHGGGPFPIDPTVGGPHSNSGTFGETGPFHNSGPFADFPNKALTQEDLTKALAKAREDGENKALDSFIEVFKAGLSDTADGNDVAHPAPGVGDRAQVVAAKVSQTHPVHKADDGVSTVVVPVVEAITKEDVIASMNGDQGALLKIARGIKSNPSGVPSSIQGTKLMSRS